MASFASSATTGGARKHAWTKKIPHSEFCCFTLYDDIKNLTAFDNINYVL